MRIWTFSRLCPYEISPAPGARIGRQSSSYRSVQIPLSLRRTLLLRMTSSSATRSRARESPVRATYRVTASSMWRWVFKVFELGCRCARSRCWNRPAGREAARGPDARPVVRAAFQKTEQFSGELRCPPVTGRRRVFGYPVERECLSVHMFVRQRWPITGGAHLPVESPALFIPHPVREKLKTVPCGPGVFRLREAGSLQPGEEPERSGLRNQPLVSRPFPLAREVVVHPVSALFPIQNAWIPEGNDVVEQQLLKLMLYILDFLAPQRSDSTGVGDGASRSSPGPQPMCDCG